MNTVSFQVDGVPTPKGSITRMPNGAMLSGSSKGQRIKQGIWRLDVRAAAQEAMGDADLMTGALRVLVDCTLPYPKSVIRKYQFGWWPAKKQPDVDKLARGVLDHLKGVVWVDDAQVCWLTINKSYAWDDRPGAYIIIDEIGEESLKLLAEQQSRTRKVLAGD